MPDRKGVAALRGLVAPSVPKKMPVPRLIEQMGRSALEARRQVARGGPPRCCRSTLPPRWRPHPMARIRSEMSRDTTGLWGVSRGLTALLAALQRWGMETRKQQFSMWVSLSLWDATRSRMAGLKPIEDEARRVLPFGSPKREGEHKQPRRNTRGVARSQVDPPHRASYSCVHRPERWPDQMPLRLRRHMDGPASPGVVPPVAPLREARLNGFPEALAVVLRHRIGGGRRRVPDAAPTGSLDARFVDQPAYSLWPHSVRPLRRLAGGFAPSDPQSGNGAP